MYTESIPLVAALLMPSQIEENAPLMVPHVLDHTPLIVLRIELMMDDTAPIAALTMFWMPVHTVSMMD